MINQEKRLCSISLIVTTTFAVFRNSLGVSFCVASVAISVSQVEILGFQLHVIAHVLPLIHVLAAICQTTKQIRSNGFQHQDKLRLTGLISSISHLQQAILRLGPTPRHKPSFVIGVRTNKSVKCLGSRAVTKEESKCPTPGFVHITTLTMV